MQGIDLFSGAGGMSIGAIASNIDVHYAVEVDKWAAATFSSNHRSVQLLEKDIRNLKGADLNSLDRTKQIIIFGGPPCQGFSTSNQKNRQFDNEKNWLFQEYLRVVNEVRPDWIVFENVKGLLETEGGYFLDAVLTGFKRAGYSTSHFILNSVDFGVPQRRNRLFIVGSLNGIELLAPSPTTSKAVSVKEAFTDLPILKNGDMLDEVAYPKAAQSSYARALRGSLISCHNNLVSANSPHIVQRYVHIPQGGNWEDIPQHLMRNYADRTRCHTGIYRRLSADEPSVVIGNFRKNMLIHPWLDRGLSVREAARLQSFPDCFRFVGSIGFQQQQVGNAVPPLMAKAVFSKIMGHG